MNNQGTSCWQYHGDVSFRGAYFIGIQVELVTVAFSRSITMHMALFVCKFSLLKGSSEWSREARRNLTDCSVSCIWLAENKRKWVGHVLTIHILLKLEQISGKSAKFCQSCGTYLPIHGWKFSGLFLNSGIMESRHQNSTLTQIANIWWAYRKFRDWSFESSWFWKFWIFTHTGSFRRQICISVMREGH